MPLLRSCVRYSRADRNVRATRARSPRLRHAIREANPIAELGNLKNRGARSARLKSCPSTVLSATFLALADCSELRFARAGTLAPTLPRSFARLADRALSFHDAIDKLRIVAPNNSEHQAAIRARRNLVQILMRTEEYGSASALPCGVVANATTLSLAPVLPYNGYVIEVRHRIASGLNSITRSCGAGIVVDSRTGMSAPHRHGLLDSARSPVILWTALSGTRSRRSPHHAGREVRRRLPFCTVRLSDRP